MLFFLIEFIGPAALAAVNGRLLKRLSSQKWDKTVPKCTNCSIVLGQYFRDENPFIGKIVDLAFWNRSLTDDEMRNYTNCQNYVEYNGNYIPSKVLLLILLQPKISFRYSFI